LRRPRRRRRRCLSSLFSHRARTYRVH